MIDNVLFVAIVIFLVVFGVVGINIVGELTAIRKLLEKVLK